MNTEVSHQILEFTREIQKLSKADSAVCIILQLDAIRDKFSENEWNVIINMIQKRYAANNSPEQL